MDILSIRGIPYVQVHDDTPPEESGNRTPLVGRGCHVCGWRVWGLLFSTSECKNCQLLRLRGTSCQFCHLSMSELVFRGSGGLDLATFRAFGAESGDFNTLGAVRFAFKGFLCLIFAIYFSIKPSEVLVQGDKRTA